MNCREFEIEWAALDDAARLPAALQQHRQECRGCANLVADLNAIVSEARAMQATEEPPQRVWAAVRNQLELEGLLREPASQQASSRRLAAPAAGWLFRLPMGLAYTAVFFVAVGVMYMYTRTTSPGPQPPTLAVTAPVPEMAWMRPDTAAQDQKVGELLARIPEERRETFVSNWNQVNSSIESLQSFVEANPDDPFATELLKNSLQQKEYLRGTLVGWEGF